MKNKEINKIIITGMGPCHTAAEAIAYHMRENFYPSLSKISISAVRYNLGETVSITGTSEPNQSTTNKHFCIGFQIHKR